LGNFFLSVGKCVQIKSWFCESKKEQERAMDTIMYILFVVSKQKVS
jgi:hypothetical protein